MSSPNNPVGGSDADSNRDLHNANLRNEIIESEKSQADILKWKLIAIAGVASVSLGVGSAGSVPEAARLLICLVPLICAYVDLVSLHIMIRIVTIGIYLKMSGNRYEQFAFKVRYTTNANPFIFEAVVLHGSSVAFNLIILGLGFVFPHTLTHWQSTYTTAYAVAGVLGLMVTVFSWVMYTMRAREVTNLAKEFFAVDRIPLPRK